MKRGTFPASLYGRTVRTISVTQVTPPLRAVMLDAQRIRCGDLFINDPHPITALCQALVDRGDADRPVQVWHTDRSPALFIASPVATAQRQ